jgi:AcrR family transcriptional regulator
MPMLRPSGETRRSAILDAVVRVIIDIGYTDMTVADVAKQAGVSTALVHYHFDSKAALITAALRVASDEDKQLRDSIVAAGGPAIRRLDRVLCGSLPDDPAPDASWLLWIETWGETRRRPELREVMADLNAHERDVVLELLAEGEAADEFRCADHAGTTARLTALRDGLAIEHTLFDVGETPEEMADQLRAAIMNNLGLAPQVYAELTDTSAVEPRYTAPSVG